MASTLGDCCVFRKLVLLKINVSHQDYQQLNIVYVTLFCV